MKSAVAFLGVLAVFLLGLSVFADSHTIFDGQGADGSFVGGGTLASISVEHSDFVFTDNDGNQTERVATIVNVYFTSPHDSFFGCYVIADEDFTIDPNLQRAVLQTTLSGPSNCGTVQRADGQPLQLAPAAPGMAADLQIDVLWSYYGTVGQQKGSFSDSCDLFSSQNDFQTSYAFSAGIGRVASSTRFATAPRLAASFARINSTHNESTTSGMRSLACGGGFTLKVSR